MALQHRFLPTTEHDRQKLLAACGVESIEGLLTGIPQSARFFGPLANGVGLSELEIKKKLKIMAQNSRHHRGALSFLGAGVYDHFCPSVVSQLTLRGEFLTSYTPYQPEIAQGTLQALYEFQSLIAEIFGMEVSSASHYDGSTSFAESALMALRIRAGRRKILVSAGVHPEYLSVLKTYLSNIGATVNIIPLEKDGKTSASKLASLLADDVAAVLVQSPNFFGCLEDLQSLTEQTHSKNALFCANVTEPLSLALFEPPGTYGADIATGEGQSFGLPQSFGGPYLGLFTTRHEFVRQVPGRLCGETVDALGRRSYTLTLSTREQHIRREKATSNICTNQNLCALWATIWLSLMGKQGFVKLAEQNLAKAEYAKNELIKTGKISLRYADSPTFNEFCIDLKVPAQKFVERCVKENVAPGLALQRFFPEDTTGLLLAVTEHKSRDEIDHLVELVKQFG